MMKLMTPMIFLLCLSAPWYAVIASFFTLFFIISFYCYSPLLSAQMVSPLFILDQLSWPLMALTLWVVILSILASQKIYQSKSSPLTFSSIMTILCLSLFLCFASANILMFYIFFELVLLPTLALIIIWGYQPERLQAGMYLLLYTITASLPFLLTIMFLFSTNGHLSFTLLICFPLMSKPTTIIWSLFLMAAFLVKMPMYLTHLWLPKAHVEAPVAGSMLLAGILLKLGAYGLLRLSTVSSSLIYSLLPFVLPISLWGGVMTSLICLRQSDLKALIAYSSIGHMGLVIAGIYSGTSWGYQAALTMSIAHGLCSSALFALANILYQTASTRSLFLLKGFQTLFPAMAFWWFIFSVINMAAPPSLNLLAEMVLMTSIIAVSLYTTVPLALMSFLTGAYSLVLFASTQHGAVNPLNNPMMLCKQDSHLLLLLHLVPLILMTFMPSVSTGWL
uniref:NADH-ubiquinone oxidoreductase chain 4 n=1 Tax=Siphonosoma cumanense TaxID=6444 RepID=A0A7D4V6A4_SIPCU|nr:NADH dehydrogenase subunit 4 [Siphonosoma cumanense]QKS32600.1 NADH dehydrogenase subunit 4 [Siphonosoma cumanense]